MLLLSEYFRKDGASAEVLAIDGFYAIMYYNDEDMLCEVVEFKNNTLLQVEEAAEDWALEVTKEPIVLC
tara:strand:+ start:8721 stop:8927 length:207 start_codon:yes stop_codon:yes gene_type:complete